MQAVSSSSPDILSGSILVFSPDTQLVDSKGCVIQLGEDLAILDDVI